MVKTSGGSGRGGALIGGYSKDTGAVAPSRDAYNAIKAAGIGSFTSANASAYIKVNPVTEGSERQIEWANSIKVLAMQRIDQEVENVVRKTANATESQRAQVFGNRNKLLASINADRSARSIIDKFKNQGAQNFTDAWKLYFPK